MGKSGVLILLLLLAALSSPGCRSVEPAGSLPRSLVLGRQRVTLSADSLLYACNFDGSTLPDEWQVESGRWELDGTGLVGSTEQQGAAAIWCTESFPGDVLVLALGEVLPPHSNDLNLYFAGTGSLDGACYIVGLHGWWTGRHGLERHPGGWSATLPAHNWTPGQLLRIEAGRLGASTFLLLDGEELLTNTEAEPIAADHDRIGLATWASSVRYRRVEVHRLQPNGN